MLKFYLGNTITRTGDSTVDLRVFYFFYLIFKKLVEELNYEWVDSSEGPEVDPQFEDPETGETNPVVDGDWMVIHPKNQSDDFYFMLMVNNSDTFTSPLGDGVGTNTSTYGLYARIGGEWDSGNRRFDDSQFAVSDYKRFISYRNDHGFNYIRTTDTSKPIHIHVVADETTILVLFWPHLGYYISYMYGAYIGNLERRTFVSSFKPYALLCGDYFRTEYLFNASYMTGWDGVSTKYKRFWLNYTGEQAEDRVLDSPVRAGGRDNVITSRMVDGAYLYPIRVIAQDADTNKYYVGDFKYVYQCNRLADYVIVYADFDEVSYLIHGGNWPINGITFPVDETWGVEDGLEV